MPSRGQSIGKSDRVYYILLQKSNEPFHCVSFTALVLFFVKFYKPDKKHTVLSVSQSRVNSGVSACVNIGKKETVGLLFTFTMQIHVSGSALMHCKKKKFAVDTPRDCKHMNNETV